MTHISELADLWDNESLSIVLKLPDPIFPMTRGKSLNGVGQRAVRGGGGVTGLSRQRLFVCSAYVNTYVVNEATFGNKYWLRGLMPSCHLL